MVTTVNFVNKYMIVKVKFLIIKIGFAVMNVKNG